MYGEFGGQLIEVEATKVDGATDVGATQSLWRK